MTFNDMTVEERRELLFRDCKLMSEYERRVALERRVNFIMNLIELAALTFLLAVVSLIAFRSPHDERAAYIEGYFGVDHATALAMAREGFGKTADEILKEVR